MLIVLCLGPSLYVSTFGDTNQISSVSRAPGPFARHGCPVSGEARLSPSLTAQPASSPLPSHCHLGCSHTSLPSALTLHLLPGTSLQPFHHHFPAAVPDCQTKSEHPPQFIEFSQGEHARDSTLTQKQNVPSPRAPPCQGQRFADLCHRRFALPGFELLKTGISRSSFASDLVLHCNCETTHVGTRRGPSHTSGHLPV